MTKEIKTMDQTYYDKLKDFLNTNDRFCRSSGMKITAISEGCAEGELLVEDRHLNGVNVVQGGAIFTLADFTCAAAMNSFGQQAVSLSASSSFVRPGLPPRLTARATLVNKGKTTAVFDVDVFSDDGKLVMHSTMTGFLLDRKFDI